MANCASLPTCVKLCAYIRLSLILSDINKVDATMESIQEQMQLTNEISEAISNPPAGMGIDVRPISIMSLLACAEKMYRLMRMN